MITTTSLLDYLEKNEVIALEKREDEIREELMKVRASMRRCIVKLFDI